MSCRLDQLDAIERVRDVFRRGVREVLLQCPTGWGKTFAVLHMAAQSIAKGKRVLFVAPLQEIALDVHRRVTASGARCGLALDGQVEDLDAPIVVALPWTLIARELFPAADLIIWDEARHVASDTYKAIASRYQGTSLHQGAWHLGLDATPERGDGQGLGDMFAEMVHGPSIADMVALGTLAPMQVIVAGSSGAKSKALPCSPFVAWKRWGRGLPTIVFSQHRAHARAAAADWGPRAVVLDGQTSTTVRRQVRARVERGELDALCVVKIGLEGFDCPPLGCAILARSVGPVSEYLQMLGRVRRVLASKPTSVAIDLCGSVYLHGLPDEERTWSLSGAAARLSKPGASVTVRRCEACLAVFFPRATCPSCGAPTAHAPVLPRVLSREERLQLIDHVPQSQRDRAYLDKLRTVARHRMRLPEHKIEGKALEMFRKQFKRDPVTSGEVAA